MRLYEIAKDELNKHAKDYGYYTHWCALWVSDILKKSGHIQLYSSSCTQLMKQAQSCGLYHNGSDGITVDDIVLFEFNDNRADGPDHVGIVYKTDGDYIYTYEGNTTLDGDYNNDGTDWTKNISTNKRRHKSLIYGYIRIQPNEIQLADFPPELLKGSNGIAVKMLQYNLRLRQYSIGTSGIDGIFGKDTESAVRLYQKNHNLEIDGIVGINTWTSLFKEV